MGKRNGAMLLVNNDDIPTVTSGFLAAHKPNIHHGYVFGGTPTISDVVRQTLIALLN